MPFALAFGQTSKMYNNYLSNQSAQAQFNAQQPKTLPPLPPPPHQPDAKNTGETDKTGKTLEEMGLIGSGTALSSKALVKILNYNFFKK